MLHHRNRSWLAGLAVLGLVAGTALAAPVKPNKGKTEPFATQITELHAVKVLLEKADRDYKGHRAAAVKEITVAIHELRVHKSGRHPGGKVEGGNEPQAVSDAQLREAVKELKRIEVQLASANGERAARAAVAVAKAIKELEIALEIR
jgi:hypothetical protein